MRKSRLFLSFSLLVWSRPLVAQLPVQSSSPARLGLIGDAADVKGETDGGVVLMGGGRNVNVAFRWMIERSRGGDVVIISASATAPNTSVFKLGGINSVETLKIDSRALANDERTAQTIRNAEMVFIGGGKQSEYLKFWQNTKTMEALNYLLNEKHAPVGGSSAGCAILGNLYFGGGKGNATSEKALANPYDRSVFLGRGEFLHAPYLQETITDTHYLTRKRPGRHLAYLARIQKDWRISAKGIGIDEGTAVCIDKQGIAKVYGASKAYFLVTDPQKPPEKCVAGQPLQWNAEQQAVRVYEMGQSAQDRFDVASWNPEKAVGGQWFRWWVDGGELHTVRHP
jgi:cyanophycinase-like exopeptidase